MTAPSQHRGRASRSAQRSETWTARPPRNRHPWRLVATPLTVLAMVTSLLASTAVMQGRTAVAAPGGATWAQVSTGYEHSCGVTTTGQAYCWGSNDYGQLGDGTSTDRSTPVAVLGLVSAASISVGGEHSCALVSGGQAYCWGRNFYGQLGDGTSTDRSTPAAVLGLVSVSSISAGGEHSCAVATGGQAYCWGRNFYGQLGDGTTTSRSTPVAVSGLVSAASISAGGSHSCAVATGGQAYCWGNNDYGQLGDGTTTSRSTPVAVSGLVSAASISAGGSHSCAVASTGQAYCWGRNVFGQLGDGTTTDRSTPVAVSGLSSAASIAADTWHSCAVATGGRAYCWGSNGFGQLGDGTTTDRSTPVAVSGLSSAASISAGKWHSCAVATGQAYCWGNNGSGRLGDGTTTSRSTPTAVQSPFAFGDPPGAPNPVSPTDGHVFGVSEPQVFTLVATDPEDDAYVGEVMVRNAFTDAIVTRFDTTLAASGTESRGTPVPPLEPGSYTWTARATDPAGSRRYGLESAERSLTVTSETFVCSVGTSHVDGYVSDTYLHVASQVVGDTATVCLRFDDGGPATAGGSVTVTAPEGASPPVVSTSTAVCDTAGTEPVPQPLVLGELGDPSEPETYVKYYADVRLDGSDVSVCVKVGTQGSDINLVSQAVTITVPDAGDVTPDVNFAPYAGGSPLPAEAPHDDLAQPSAACQTATSGQVTRLLNLAIDGVRTYAYVHTDTELARACVRVAGAPQEGGGVAFLDTSGFPGIAPVADVLPGVGPDDPDSPCSLQVVRNDTPVTVHLHRSSTGTIPVALCARVASAELSVQVGFEGNASATPDVGFAPDA